MPARTTTKPAAKATKPTTKPAAKPAAKPSPSPSASEKTVAQKMFLKPGMTIAVLGAPTDYRDLMGLPRGCEIVDSLAVGADAVHVFARNRAELEAAWRRIAKHLTPSMAFWVSFPKGTAVKNNDLTRDVGWDTITAAGWDGVRIVAVDAYWSSLMLKPLAPGQAPRVEVKDAPKAKSPARRG